jgi:hypothetical protein
MEKTHLFEKLYVFQGNQIPYGELDLIVLSHNGIETTKKFLDHFYKFTDNKFCRLIWIDNGSSDGSVEFLKDFFAQKLKNYVLHFSKENLGVIGGRNLGYNISQMINGRGELFPYLMFLDNDQYVEEGWLEHHLSVLNKGYDMIGVEAWKLSDAFLPILKIPNINYDFSYVGCGGMLIRREVTNRIGIFDEQFNPAYFEDPDFNFRSHDAGFKIGWNCKAKIIHFPHQTLGKMDQTNKHKKLMDSYTKFINKWKHRKPTILKQKDLPEFH